MFLNKLVDVVVICVLFVLTGLTSATELRLVRFGPVGEEKPGLIHDQNQIHDLSAIIEDITPRQLSDEALEEIAAIPLDQIPVVQGDPRLGIPLTGIGKIVAIGFNYVNHAAEMAVDLPSEPLVFMKAISALTGPFDNVIQPRNGHKLDYESELVVVIGRKAQYIAED